MEPSGVERRLAAILAADMVGYSRLMEADEVGTLARLKTHRLELIDPAIIKNKGHIIKTTGDGMLVEFRSVTEAVQCAAEVQRRMARRNADVPPARWIQFRIGINLGDVIIEEGDIFGDGVNVAARLRGAGRAGRRMRVRPQCATRSATGSTSPSRTSASRPSRTSPGRSAPSGSCWRSPAAALAAALRPRSDCRQAVDRGAPLREHERRPRAGVLR